MKEAAGLQQAQIKNPKAKPKRRSELPDPRDVSQRGTLARRTHPPQNSLGTASSPCPINSNFSFQPLQEEATQDEPVEPQETGAAGSKSCETAAHNGEALQWGEKLPGEAGEAAPRGGWKDPEDGAGPTQPPRAGEGRCRCAEVAVGSRGLGREGPALQFQFWVLQGKSFGKPKRKIRKQRRWDRAGGIRVKL